MKRLTQRVVSSWSRSTFGTRIGVGSRWPRESVTHGSRASAVVAQSLGGVVLGALLLLGLFGERLASDDSGSRAPVPDVAIATSTSTATAEPRLSGPVLPVTFVENRGQVDESVRFHSAGRGLSVFFTPDEVVMTLGPPARESVVAAGAIAAPAPDRGVVRQTFVGAGSSPRVEGLEPTAGQVSYLRGNDPSQWRAGLPTFARVAYRELYPGVDAVWYGSGDGKLEYDFIVEPGADYRQIEMCFSGADAVRIGNDGDLSLTVAGGELRNEPPFVYQESESGARERVESRYELRGDNRVAFALGAYDASRRLVIDPKLSASTYLGGALHDRGDGIAVDDDGFVYVTGDTQSIDFPTLSPIQPAGAGGQDIYVAKFDPTLGSLVYATYIGGSSEDGATELAVDADGRAWVVGGSSSADFPLASPLQGANAGADDAIVFAINGAGSALAFSTYLGGGGFDCGDGIAIDASGGVYVSGETESTDFPAVAAVQPVFGGDMDAFVAKLDFAGAPSIAYSTYLGGTGGDEADGIVVDAAGRAHVVGRTDSTDFPTASPLQAANAGDSDVFVSTLSPDGTSLLYSTYFGGTQRDDGDSIAIDFAGNLYVFGETESTDFPTRVPIQGALRGARDTFLTKFDATGSDVVYSTYLGGSSDEAARKAIVDVDGSAYLIGSTESADFPVHRPLQSFGGDRDLTVVKVDPSGRRLTYSTFLGGTGEEMSGRAALQGADLVVIGSTESADFPTVVPFQPGIGGDTDAFVARIRDVRVVVSPGDSLLFRTQDVSIGFVVVGDPDATWTRFTFNGTDKTAAVLAAATAGSIDAPGGGRTLQIDVGVSLLLNRFAPVVTVRAEALSEGETIVGEAVWTLVESSTP